MLAFLFDFVLTSQLRELETNRVEVMDEQQRFSQQKLQQLEQENKVQLQLFFCTCNSKTTCSLDIASHVFRPHVDHVHWCVCCRS